MPLDPVIAGGFRGLQLQDPLEQFGRISQIQQAQQQNQLAALKMQEYQRGVETANRLRSLDPAAPNYMTEVMRLDPELGSQLMLRGKQQTAAERAAAASEAELRGKNLSFWQQLARNSANAPTDEALTGLARRAVELGVTDEGTATSQLQQLLGMPPEQRSRVLAQYGRQQYMSTPYGPFDPETGEFKMPPSLPARAPAPGAPAPTPAAPKPPVGYRFTDSGNLEPIPGGPAARKVAGAGAAPAAPGAKPPTAAQVAKTEAQAQARQALSQDLQTVLGYYNTLNKMGGMTSPTRSIAENVLASARATGLGQEAERTMATQAQTLRDNISNSRQRLLVHIKNATGASAQQMNSNVELQTWLNALTNPRQSIETVRETLGQLDSVIASVQNQVNKETPSKSTPAPASAAPLTPAEQAELDALRQRFGSKRP